MEIANISEAVCWFQAVVGFDCVCHGIRVMLTSVSQVIDSIRLEFPA